MIHRAISSLCSCTLGLALWSLPLFLTSCDNDNPADGKNPPGDSPGKAAQNSLSPFNVIPDLPAAPSPAMEAGPAETSPGLRQQKFIAPLRDAYERMDPARDGWSSEAFSAAAKEQLSLLEKLLENPRPRFGAVSDCMRLVRLEATFTPVPAGRSRIEVLFWRPRTD